MNMRYSFMLVPILLLSGCGGSPETTPLDVYAVVLPTGGKMGVGAIYSLSDSMELDLKYEFTSGAPYGTNPGGFVVDDKGMLTAFTKNGGLNNNGAFFRYDLNTGEPRLLGSNISDWNIRNLYVNDGVIYGYSNKQGQGLYFRFDEGLDQLFKAERSDIFTPGNAFFMASPSTDDGKFYEQTDEKTLMMLPYDSGLVGIGANYYHPEGAEFAPQITELYFFKQAFNSPTATTLATMASSRYPGSFNITEGRVSFSYYDLEVQNYQYAIYDLKKDTLIQGSFPEESLTGIPAIVVIGQQLIGLTDDGILLNLDLNHPNSMWQGTTRYPNAKNLRAWKDKVIFIAAGDINTGGGIYLFDPAINNTTSLMEFTKSETPKYPITPLVLCNTRYYGLTQEGGESKAGTLFSLNKDLGDFKVELEFDENTGTQPRKLVSAKGKIFGIARTGGYHNSGTLFEFNPADHAFKVIQYFKEEEGVWPIEMVLKENRIRVICQKGKNVAGYMFTYSVEKSSPDPGVLYTTQWISPTLFQTYEDHIYLYAEPSKEKWKPIWYQINDENSFDVTEAILPPEKFVSVEDQLFYVTKGGLFKWDAVAKKGDLIATLDTDGWHDYLSVLGPHVIATTWDNSNPRKSSIIAYNPQADSVKVLLKGEVIDSDPQTEKVPVALIISGKDVSAYTDLVGNQVAFKVKDGDVCRILKKGRFAEVKGKGDYWYKVQFQNQEGWVFGGQSNLKRR